MGKGGGGKIWAKGGLVAWAETGQLIGGMGLMYVEQNLPLRLESHHPKSEIFISHKTTQKFCTDCVDNAVRVFCVQVITKP